MDLSSNCKLCLDTFEKNKHGNGLVRYKLSCKLRLKGKPVTAHKALQNQNQINKSNQRDSGRRLGLYIRIMTSHLITDDLNLSHNEFHLCLRFQLGRLSS